MRMREDRDLRTYTRRGALGLMGAGGVFAATETFGFTELTADRGVGVSVGDDADAGVKIVDNSDDPGPITDATFTGAAEIKFINDTQSDIYEIKCSLINNSNAAITGDKDFNSSGNLADSNAPLSDYAVLKVNNTTTGEDPEKEANPDLEITILFGDDSKSEASTVIELVEEDARSITIEA
jgi:hypothetical protein